MVSGQFEQRALGRVGTVLREKYHLDELLGVGGMAVVYKATHRNQAEFAIKMLHAELSINADIRARFLREGYAANSVKHPGVVLVVDDDVAEDGAAFLVMELLSGMGCDKLAAHHGGRLPLDAACAVGLELLDVLMAAHAKGIVHRDIKPPNLFVTRDAVLKVLDFGIARVRDTMTSGAQATGTGVVLGTPAFMSPEQALGRANDVDLRTDLWAVGATVFMLASGAMVHEAETGPQLLVKLATQKPRSLAALVPDAPRDIVEAVDRALAFDKAQRWPSASAMHGALGSAVRAAYGPIPPRAVLARVMGLPEYTVGPLAPGASAASGSGVITSEPVSRESPEAPRKQSNRLAAKVLVTAAAVLLIGGGVAAMRHARTASPPPPAAAGLRAMEQVGDPANAPTPPPVVSSLSSGAPSVPALEPVKTAEVRTRNESPPQRPPKRPGPATPPQLPQGTSSTAASTVHAHADSSPPASTPHVPATTELLDGRH